MIRDQSMSTLVKNFLIYTPFVSQSPWQSPRGRPSLISPTVSKATIISVSAMVTTSVGATVSTCSIGSGLTQKSVFAPGDPRHPGTNSSKLRLKQTSSSRHCIVKVKLESDYIEKGDIC